MQIQKQPLNVETSLNHMLYDMKKKIKNLVNQDFKKY
jgi:hypothetical protein